jgi:hypothetical protein
LYLKKLENQIKRRSARMDSDCWEGSLLLLLSQRTKVRILKQM